MLSRLLESRGSGVRLTQCVPRIGRSTREYDVRACDAHAAVLCVDPIHLKSYTTETATRARAEMNNENNSRCGLETKMRSTVKYKDGELEGEGEGEGETDLWSRRPAVKGSRADGRVEGQPELGPGVERLVLAHPAN